MISVVSLAFGPCGLAVWQPTTCGPTSGRNECQNMAAVVKANRPGDWQRLAASSKNCGQMSGKLTHVANRTCKYMDKGENVRSMRLKVFKFKDAKKWVKDENAKIGQRKMSRSPYK
jgi:hypothetical protein